MRFWYCTTVNIIPRPCYGGDVILWHPDIATSLRDSEVELLVEFSIHTFWALRPPAVLNASQLSQHLTNTDRWPGLLTSLTWDLGGELGDDGGAVAFGRARTQGEGVRGARVQACEHVGGLVAQLHHLPTLVGEVQLGVKGAHRLVGDLGRKDEMNILTLWPLVVVCSLLSSDLYSLEMIYIRCCVEVFYPTHGSTVRTARLSIFNPWSSSPELLSNYETHKAILKISRLLCVWVSEEPA